MSLDKHSCVTRAKVLLSTPTEENLRYAALELRLCIEALTYESLAAHANMIPPEVLATWQPPQAVKALLEFEPSANTAYQLFAGVEDVPGVEAKEVKYVGKCEPLKVDWLRKHYNKLGNLLHGESPTKRTNRKPDSTLTYLNEVIADLAEPLSANLRGSGIRNVYTFQCAGCNKPVVANMDAVAKTRRARCFNPQCSLEYHAEPQNDGTALFTPLVTEFECMRCAAITKLENRFLKIGAQFKCVACKAKHIFTECEWGYILEDELPQTMPSQSI